MESDTRGTAMADRRVLIISYSFTQQTRVLVQRFAAGLASAGVTVVQERLEPIAPYAYPFKNDLRLGIAMAATFLQRRMPIRPVSEQCLGDWDCIVLAGPTWSYNPSGPMLDFLDRFGAAVCGGQRVVPLISCRAYWQLHHWVLKRLLLRHGVALIDPPVVFAHPIGEPWRSLGLLLKLRGKIGWKRYRWVRRFYPRYGHSEAQRGEAEARGRLLGQRLVADLGQ